MARHSLTLILLTASNPLTANRSELVGDGRRRAALAMFYFWSCRISARAISCGDHDPDHLPARQVFAEIYVTTSGGPGLASTNLAFLIYLRALREYDVGGASAAGVIAVILANIVAIFLVRSIAKNIAD